MKQSLFKISTDMQMIINHLIDNGGELTPEVEQALEITQVQLEGKAVSYATVIRAMEYDNATIDAEIKRLQGIKKTRTNAVDRLKTALTNAMIQFDIPEIENATCKINFRKSTTLEITNDAVVPKKYKTQVVTTKIDKNAIKKDIKDGATVKGAQLIENQNLQIK